MPTMNIDDQEKLERIITQHLANDPWRTGIDDKIAILSNSQSELHVGQQAIIEAIERNTSLTKDVLEVAAAFRKVGLWSRIAATFVKTKAEWSLKAGSWTSFHVIRPIGFAAAGFVAIWQAWVQIPWSDLSRAISAFFWKYF